MNIITALKSQLEYGVGQLSWLTQLGLSTLISINKLERFVGWHNVKRIGNPKPTYMHALWYSNYEDSFF